MNFNEKHLDSYRGALGAFVTGVTIVTTLDGNNRPVGLTVNSFTSVSLEPPLLLWGIDKRAGSHDIFLGSGHFAVHVLHEGQRELAGLFSERMKDKFGGLRWRAGVAGSPLLPDYLCCFECVTVNAYEGGDHSILLGEVGNYEVKEDRPPLLFHNGAYRGLG